MMIFLEFILSSITVFLIKGNNLISNIILNLHLEIYLLKRK